MSDQNTSLPIKTEGDLQDKVQSKIVDFIDPTLGMQVDSDKNAHVEIHGNDSAGVDRVMQLSESGNVVLDAEYNVATNTKPSTIGLMAHIRTATPGLADLLQRITSVTNGIKRLLDVSIHDENGAAYSDANPMPVTLVGSEGTIVNDYATAVAVASAAVSNHDYTVTALKTLKLAQIHVAASGKIKVELEVETGVATGVFAAKFVAFNSVANPQVTLDVKELINVAAGIKVRIAITNKEALVAQDVYSTISGHEV